MKLLFKHYNVIAFVLVLVFIGISLIKIAHPGLQYDEVLFGNAAIGGRDGTFIVSSFHGFPFMLMPYIGALKAYVFYPIFELFGVSVYSIRIPVVLITGLSLYLLFVYTRIRTTPKIALLTVVLLVMDPSLISFTRTDVGPNVLELFFKIGVLLSFTYFVQKKRAIWLAITFICMGLGLYNKLNFLWFINAFTASILLVYFKDLISYFLSLKLANKLIHLGIAIAGYSILFLYYLRNIRRFHIVGEIGFANITLNLSKITHNFIGILNGTSYYEYVFGPLQLKISGIYLKIIISILLIGFILFLTFRRKFKTDFKQFYIFNLLIVLFTVLQIYPTRQATAPWHIMTLYPFVSTLLALSLYVLYKIAADHRMRKFAFALVYFPVIIILSYQIFLYSHQIRSLDKPTANVAWSNSINDLLAFVSQNPAEYASLDWGIHNQILITSSKSTPIPKELAFSMITYPDTFGVESFREAYLLPEKNIKFILHGEGKEIFPKSRENFFRIVDESNLHAKIITTIRDDNNTVIFEIYTIQSQ